MALTVDETRNPIKVTGTTAATEEITNRIAFIKFIYWYNPTTAGDLCVLQDKEGAEIIAMRCETDAESQMWPLWATFHGLQSDNVDSGTLYIYIS
jgi:hypothetical protein